MAGQECPIYRDAYKRECNVYHEGHEEHERSLKQNKNF